MQRENCRDRKESDIRESQPESRAVLGAAEIDENSQERSLNVK
jgi:hypothetical protein